MRQLSTLFICLWFCHACVPLIQPEKKPTLGELDLKDMIALGDRYVAGMSNGSREAGIRAGLYAEAQEYAFPVLMAAQLKQVSLSERRGGVSFSQHLASDGGSGFFQLDEITYRECDDAIQTEVLGFNAASPNWILEKPSDDILHNFGIPFLKVSQLFDHDALSSNLFFQRMQREDTIQDILHFFKERNPSFALIWLGMEDVLDHATTGAGNPAFPLTPAAEFAENYSRLMDSLEAHASEKFVGLIGNLPPIDQFPYFKTVPSRFQESERCVGEGSPIYYEAANGEILQANEEVAIHLSLLGQIGREVSGGERLGLSSKSPLPNVMVLDSVERRQIRLRIQAYNSSLDSLVSMKNMGLDRPKWVLANLITTFQALDNEIRQGGLSLTNEHLSGGVFSLDGLTLTPRGNALLANAFMEALNAQSRLEVRLPVLDLPDYPGVVYP